MSSFLRMRVIDKKGGVLLDKELRGFPLTVGRAENADVRIDDPYLSQVHFELKAGPAGYAVCNRSESGIFQGAHRREQILIPHSKSCGFETMGYRIELEAVVTEAQALEGLDEVSIEVPADLSSPVIEIPHPAPAAAAHAALPSPAPAAGAAAAARADAILKSPPVSLQKPAPVPSRAHSEAPRQLPLREIPGARSAAAFVVFMAALTAGVCLSLFELPFEKVALSFIGIPLYVLIFAGIAAFPLALVAKLRSSETGYRDYFALIARAAAVAPPLCLAVLGGMMTQGDAALAGCAAWACLCAVGGITWFKAFRLLRFGSAGFSFVLTSAVAIVLAAPPIMLELSGRDNPSGYRMISWTDVLPPRLRTRTGDSSEHALQAAFAASFSKVRMPVLKSDQTSTTH